ncbi:MAG: ABC transporter substrate-binding protein [Actinomycetota bacterium]
MTIDLLKHPQVVDDLTRREFITGLTAAGLLAACGRNQPGGDAAVPTATRSFKDVAGNEILVPGSPQRIVAIHDVNGGRQVLELGFSLVGMATRGPGFDPGGPVEFNLAGVEQVGEVYEPNVEKIAELKPDLIVGEGFKGKGMDQFFSNPSLQEQLERLAPVIYIDTFRPVAEVMADFAQLLGPAAEQREQQLRQSYEADVAALRAELAPKIDRLSAVFVVMRADNQLGLRGKNATPLTVTLTALGINQPAVTESEGADGFPKLSLELIPQVGADVIFLEGPGGDAEFFADYTTNPLWQRLDAVVADQVHLVDQRMSGQTYATYDFVLQQVRAALAGANPDVIDESSA